MNALEVSPIDLNEFLERIKDLKGYITALMVNYHGSEEFLLSYAEYLRKVLKGEMEHDNPIEFTDTLRQLRGELAALIFKAPDADKEAIPAINTIDAIFNLVRLETK